MTSESYAFLEQTLTHDIPSTELRNVYNKWAKDYDKETDAHGYVIVSCFLEKLVKYLQSQQIDRNVKIIDVGAGTGKLGVGLKTLGYENIDGLDLSSGMLKIAKGKGVYNHLFCEAIGEGTLSLPKACYDLLTSTATFSFGHAKPAGLEEAADLVKPGGILAFTVRQDVFSNKSYGYEDKIEELTQRNVWTIVHHSVIDYDLLCAIPGGRSGHMFICLKN